MLLTYPKIVSRIDIPLDVVSITLRCKGIESMAFGYLCSFVVRLLLVLFIVPVVGVDDIGKLSHIVLDVCGFNLCIFQT